MKIIAYGFKEAGFQQVPMALSVGESLDVTFLHMGTPLRLDEAAGVIVPQGIFESIQFHSEALGDHTTITVDKALLYDREKQVLNLLADERRWICFLVRQIIDEVPQWDKPLGISNTDLCKRVLNRYEVSRRKVDGTPVSRVEAEEFQEYMHDFGIAQTILIPHRDSPERMVLAYAGGFVAGVEFENRAFFLPYHSALKDAGVADRTVRLVVQAITAFRERRLLELPDWANSFTFETEQRLRLEAQSLESRLDSVKTNLEHWTRYKAVLTTTGEALRGLVLDILEEYFGLKLGRTDTRIEDATILGDDGQVRAVLEIKGTKGGVKRDNVSQVDSERERRQLPLSVPGVLIMNADMRLDSFEARVESEIPEDQVRLAKCQNILVVRTIDLLNLMRHLETASARKEVFLRCIDAGGGWLRADATGYSVVSGT